MENQNKPHFIEIQHPADWAIQVFADSPEQLFVYCLEGMYSLIKMEVIDNPSFFEFNLSLEAVDLENLLVSFLSEMLFYIDTEEIVFQPVGISIYRNNLQAKLKGRKIKTYREEIKAVTYHQMKIEQQPEGLSVTVVFDV